MRMRISVSPTWLRCACVLWLAVLAASDSAMSDFPSSECPSIPWRDAVQRVPLGNTAAPGPPTVRASHLVGKKRKSPLKMAANLGGSCSGAAPAGDDCSKHNGNDVGTWDPMSLDFHSAEFNTYDSGVGALMQSRKNGGTGASGDGGDITLFVSNIPTGLTRDGFRNLFSRAGKVKRVHIVKPTTPDKPMTYGFADFGTIKEADAAIQMLHNFDMGDGVRLGVKVSETKENRERRLAKKKEEDDFISTLNCGRYTTEDEPPPCASGYDLTAQEMKHCETSPFLPSYKSHLPQAHSPQEPSGTEEEAGHEGEGAEGFSLGDSAGAQSLQAVAMTTQTSPSKPSPPLPATDSSSSTSPSGMCVKCGTPCKMKCIRCKAPYCSKKCQASDWPKHRFECRESGVTRSTSSDAQPGQATTDRASSPPVIREKECSEDEGFDIPTPPLEELMNVLQNQKDSTVSKVSKRLSCDNPATESTVSLPPEDTIVEEPSSPAIAEKTPLSLPIVKNPAVKQTQALLTPPKSPSQSPVDVRNCAVPKPLPLAPVPSPVPSPGHSSSSSSNEPLSLTELLESFENASFPLPSIPLGSMLPQRFNGIVTSAVSCVWFSTVLMSVETKQALKTIKNCGVSTTLAPAEPLCLVVGSKVGYLDSNGDLYRMEVVKMPTASDDIVLRYYDIGSCFKCSLSHHRLVTLPEAIVTVPCLRYKCTLDQLQVKDNVGSSYLMSIVRGNPVRITNIGRHQSVTSSDVFYKCDAHFLDGRPISPLVVEYLKQQPQSVIMTSPSPSLPSPHKVAAMVPRSPPNSVFGTPSFPPVINKPFLPLLPNPQQPPVSLKKDRYKLMHMAKDVQLHRVPMKEDFVIIPRIVDSPSSIWAHVKHPQLSNLYQMQEDLNREYSSGKGEVYSPSVGEMCVVRYCQDKQFYRAEVLCVNNNGTVDVRFVDYGNREMILVSQVQHIRPIYLTLPIQALHFSLAGVAPSGHTLSWSDSAITYLKDKILNRELTARVIGGKLNSFLVSLCDPDNPRKSLAEAMISNGCCEKSSDKGPDSSLGMMPGVKALQSPPPLGAPRADYRPPLSPVHPHSRTLRSSHSLSSPSVKKVLPFGQASEGGFAAKPRSPPSPITPHTSSLPTPSPPLQGQRGDGAVISTPPRTPSGETGASSPRRGLGSRGVGAIKVPQISLPCHVEHTVVVTSAVSPYVFHVQKMDREVLTSLFELTQQLNSTSLEPLSDHQVNAFCVARYAEEGLLYRSKIIKCSGSKCTVKFIDYGNIEDVPVADIYALPPDFASLPAQAILCTLKDFRQVGKREPGRKQPEPSSDSIHVFNALGLDKQVTIKVSVLIDTNPMLFPKHVVDISVDDGEDKKDVLTALVHGGHSLPVVHRFSPKKQNSGGGGREGGGGFRKGKSREGGGGGGFKQRGHENHSRQKSMPSKPWGARAGAGGGGSGSPQLSSNPPDTCKMEERGGQEESLVARQEQPLLSPTQTSSLGQPLESSSPAPSCDFPPLSSLPVTELPSDKEYVEVIVTDATQPPILYVQLATESSFQNVSNLQTGLNSHSLLPPASSSPSTPPLNHVCCCKYPLDNLWYRAAVIEARGRECVVQFIDYGNTDTVPLSSVFPCPPEFFNIPIMAVQCSLDGVCPPPPSFEWPQQAVSFLQQKCYDRVLLAKVESQDSGLPRIQLIDTSSDRDIFLSAELISAGLAVASPLNEYDPHVIPSPTINTSHVPPPTINTPHVPPPTINTPHVPPPTINTPHVPPPTINTPHVPPPITNTPHVPPPTINTPRVPPPTINTPRVPTNTPQVSDIPPYSTSKPHAPPASLPMSQPVSAVAWTPVTHLPGPVLPEAEEFEVLVMSVTSLTELYIHPVTSDTPHNMTTYMASITVYCSAQTTPPDTPPPIGNYCFALFSDGNWFRAKVEAVDSTGGSVDVLFVDFGNRDTVSVAHIRPMAAQFTDLPVQVMRCGLYGLEPVAAMDPDPAACSLLGEITTTSKMKCRVVCRCPLLVDLVSPSTLQSVRADLSATGHLPSPPPDAVFSVPSSSLTAGARTNVLVSEVQGPGSFWVQSLESPNIARLPPLMNAIGTYCSSWPLVAPRTPLLGELCCAKFSTDKVWYRARVIAFLSLSECRVRFLDYGNCEVCAVSAMLPATSELLSLPALAIPCSLVGWEDSGEEEGGGESEVNQRFKSLAENQSLQAMQKMWRNGRAVLEMSGADGPIQL